ncbi:MAG TPA: hypothetical protein VJU80_02890, partial [Solirubrobacteraceae bacterium]|nr:hypothetical protein [Solirubrobacteraceae bacterium]
SPRSLELGRLPGPVAFAAFLHRGARRRCAARASHRDVALLDKILRPGVPVLAALDPTPRIAGPVERVDVALLLRRGGLAFALAEQPLQHEPGLPGAPLH